ncbi:MAG TPA: hypothetical protein VE222_02805, partial [Nitrospiraceae bacterium]|nr:hypothetical protein [Nitrospiraceae bacterium]
DHVPIGFIRSSPQQQESLHVTQPATGYVSATKESTSSNRQYIYFRGMQLQMGEISVMILLTTLTGIQRCREFK